MFALFRPTAPIGNPFFIDQQGKRDTGFLSKHAGIIAVPQPDRCEAGTGSLEPSLVFAQLRDMLAAEDSAVVPEKHHYRGGFLPQRSQADIASVYVREDESRQRRTQRIGHHHR
jgi:hypothetical protein